MTGIELLKRNLLEDREGEPFFSTAELNRLLKKHEGDIRKATYEGLLMKAEEDATTLPDGAKVASARDYWLTLARQYRGGTRVIRRADEAGR